MAIVPDNGFDVLRFDALRYSQHHTVPNYYNNNGLSPRDRCMVDRYRQLIHIAMDMRNDFGFRSIEDVVTGLATIDLQVNINDLKIMINELPSRMPKCSQSYDIRVITDKINAAMSDVYR